MPTLRIRVLGSETDTNTLITMLHGVDGIEHVEEVADLMSHMDDEDSSSLGLLGDIGPGVHEIEVKVPDRLLAERIREIAGEAADAMGATVEFVEDS